MRHDESIEGVACPGDGPRCLHHALPRQGMDLQPQVPADMVADGCSSDHSSDQSMCTKDSASSSVSPGMGGKSRSDSVGAGGTAVASSRRSARSIKAPNEQRKSRARRLAARKRSSSTVTVVRIIKAYPHLDDKATPAPPPKPAPLRYGALRTWKRCSRRAFVTMTSMLLASRRVKPTLSCLSAGVVKV